MAFVFGLVALGVALWFLVRLKRKDTADCAAVLGLPPAPAATTRGTTPEGFEFSETSVLSGTLLGRRAVLLERFVRHPAISARRRKGSHFTVLELTLERPVRVPIRLQPTGVLGALEALVKADTADSVSTDPEFDAAYTVYAADASAVAVLLDPDLRQHILAFRSEAAGELPDSVPGRLSSGLVLGTFHVEGATARYVLFGSPTKATAQQLKAAAPLLLAIATRAGA